MSRLVTLIVSLLLSATGLCASASAIWGDPQVGDAQPSGWRSTEEVWYCLTLAGAPCGYARVLTEEKGAEGAAPQLWRTSNETLMRVGRAGASVEIRISWVFTEDSSGKPISCETTQVTAGTPLKTEYRWTDGGITAVTIQGERKTARTIPNLEGECLPPHAMDVAGAENRRQGKKEFSLRGIDPANGINPVTVTSKFEADDDLQIGGKALPTERWGITNDLVPVPSTEWVDADGKLIRSVTKIPFGDMEMLQCTEGLAKAETGNKGMDPEVLTSTFAKPDKPIDSPRQTRSITYKVKSKDGSVVTLESAGAQSVRSQTDGSLEVTVDIGAPSVATEAEVASPAFTRASAMLDSNDPRLKSLTKQALGKLDESATAREKASTLRAFVNAYIKAKDLSTAFGTASDVARSKSGDCSEHAVLLSGLLRCAGIPSRVAAGMVYADAFAGERGIFGWHMWSQAIIDGRWVDLDATLPVDFDAAHILAMTSAMESESLDPKMGALVMVVGNLNVEVVEIKR